MSLSHPTFTKVGAGHEPSTIIFKAITTTTTTSDTTLTIETLILPNEGFKDRYLPVPNEGFKDRYLPLPTLNIFLSNQVLASRRWYVQRISGQSYKASTIVIYNSRVVPDLKIPHITTLGS